MASLAAHPANHRLTAPTRPAAWAARLRALALAALMAAAALAALRLVGKAPWPAILSLAKVLAVVSLVWLLSKHAPSTIRRSAARLLAAWLVASALVAAGLYFGDASRWWWHRATGYNLTPRQSPAMPGSAAELIEQHPWLTVDPADAAHLIVPEGEYVVSRTVAVPQQYRLTIQPGATLRLANGCSLICYGPVRAVGTAGRPIRFVAARSWLKWGAVAVVDAPECRFEHVEFADSRHAQVDGVDLPGGLTILGGQARVADCRFQQVFGRDAMNLRDCRAEVIDNRVVGAVQDGFDFDGGSGLVSGNVLVDCGDEGLDLSDNDRLQVRGNTIRDRRGGRLAAERRAEALRAANRLEHSDR